MRIIAGSLVIGLTAGEYATVQDVDAGTNRLTVMRDTVLKSRTIPRRLQG